MITDNQYIRKLEERIEVMEVNNMARITREQQQSNNEKMDLTEGYHKKEMVKDFVKNLRNQKPETMIPLTDEEIETIKDLVVNEFENIMSDLDGNYITFEKCLDELRPILNLERKLRVI